MWHEEPLYLIGITKLTHTVSDLIPLITFFNHIPNQQLSQHKHLQKEIITNLEFIKFTHF